jgi:putative oxidoreductase
MRIGIGLSYIGHGWPKLTGGPDYWRSVGGAMANWGITFAPEYWGLLAGLTELGGGVFLALGLFFRPVCILLFITMIVATSSHLHNGDDFSTLSHALEMAIVFFSLYFTGPGRYSLDYNFGKYRSPNL